MRYILLLTLLLSYSINSRADCYDSPTNVTLRSLTVREPTIYSNGSLRISTGTEPAQLVDVYTSQGNAYSGIVSSGEREEDSDNRNILLKWAFPKELQPTQYYIVLRPSDSARADIQGKKTMKVYMTIRGSNSLVRASFFIDEGISFNCRPILQKEPSTNSK